MLRLLLISTILFLTQSSFGQHCTFDDNHQEDGAIYLNEVNGTLIPHNAQGAQIIPHDAFRMSAEDRENAGLATRIGANGDLKGTRNNNFGVVFNITYLDVVNGTGAGFADPVLGAERRASLEAAFQYYSSVIMDAGEVDIEIRESFSASPNSNPFAFSAAYYFGSKGFNHPFTRYHAVSGNDPYEGFPDGYIQFNFHSGMNYHYGVGSYPGDDEFDFYTIALHEIMHLLGFTSYATSNGQSAALEHVFTSFDEHLVDFEKDLLFEKSGSGSGTTVSTPSPSLLVNNQVWFELYSNQFAPVFSPDPFNDSSLDHFDNSRSGHGEYLMHPSLSRGDAFKLLHEDEVRVLEMLGYNANYSVATSIDDHVEDGPVSVLSTLYPNPAHSNESVQINIGEVNAPEILVIVYDMLGRESYSKVVLNEGPGPVTAIDPYNNLSSGMYIVIGSTNDELFNEKLVIK